VNRTLLWGAVIIGIVFVGVMVLYLVEPAQQLPAFMPGYAPGDAGHHTKHAIGALIVALALFAFAWFRSKPATR
jgi:amino acid permease